MKMRTLLGAGLALLTIGTAAAPADAAGIAGPREYDVKLSVSMKSDFNFNVDPTGCNGRKPNGWIGSGQEILEATSPKPVRVTVWAMDGGDIVMNRKDHKNHYELSGTTKRTGQMQQQVCDEMPDPKFTQCLGEHRFDTQAEIRFMGARWNPGDTQKVDSRDVVPACDNGAFPWDSAVHRTGTVLLESAIGSAAKLKKSKGQLTLTATDTEQCDVEFFGTGSCSGTWTWKLKMTPVKGKRKRR